MLSYLIKKQLGKKCLKQERSGEFLMLAFAFFEGWFPIFTLLTLQYITPVFAYSFTLVFSIISFMTLVILRKKFTEFFLWSAWKDLLLTSFFISLMFACIYIGLSYTSAGNMAVLIFLQVFFSFFYFNLIGGEKFALIHLSGALLMAAGAIIILFPDELVLNFGDLLILLAAAIAPIANLYQKRARRQVSSETILAFRSIIALPVLLLIAIVFEPLPEWDNMIRSLPYIAATGLLLMGLSKIFWVESIHRISITKASAMAALIPVFTLLFAYLTLNEVPENSQFAGIFPVLIGGYLISRKVEH